MGRVPEHLRPALHDALQALVAGARPESTRWVDSYGERGATLVQQPDDVWEHPRTEAVETATGEWHVVLPLWTTQEFPSDLVAEVLIDRDGRAALHDVRVL